MNHLCVFVKWDSKFFSFCKFDWFSLRSERVLPARQGHVAAPTAMGTRMDTKVSTLVNPVSFIS